MSFPDGSSRPAREVFVARLRAMPALASLSDEALQVLARAARFRTFSEETTVLPEGSRSESFFILLQGRAKVCRHLANGRTAVLGLLGPGDLFGTVAALGDGRTHAATVAMGGVACLEIPREALFASLAQKPALFAELMPILTRRLAECRHCLVELSCYRVESRFAHLLLGLAETEGVPRSQGTFLPIRLSRQELADMTGTTVETCIRIMSRWSKQKVVETRKNGFLVRDLNRLRQAADRG